MENERLIGVSVSGPTVVSVRRERNDYERHLAAQPYLADFMPTHGPVPDDAVKNFMDYLQHWLEEEKRLRAIYRPNI